MAIFFIDSMAHYTTSEQGASKIAAYNYTSPVAGTGAFGAPGLYVYNVYEAWVVNFSPTATLEFSAYVKPALLGSASAYPFHITWLNGDGRQCTLYTTVDGQLQLWINDVGSGTAPGLISSSPVNAIAFNVQHHLYVSMVISNTVGAITVRVDGTDVGMSPGTGLDTQNQSTATITRLHINKSTWSHVALANAIGDITGQPRVEAIFPDGAGNYSAWTPTAGANYTNVDETTPNDDTDYVNSSTAAQRDSYTYSNLLGTATNILAVALVPRVRKDDAVARTVKRFVRAGGVNYDGAVVAVPASYAYLQEVLPTNPATGVAWTVAEVNAIEAGLKVES